MKKVLPLLFAGSNDANVGLLLMRLFVGAGMLTHGIPKLLGGVDFWSIVGGVMAEIGVPGSAVFWGAMAAFAESFGALFILFGVLSRVGAFLLVINMAVVAFVAHAGQDFNERELALFYLFGAALFLLKGPGRYSIDHWIRGWLDRMPTR